VSGHTEHACPGCGAPPSLTVGAPYVGAVGFLWWRRSFEEELYRCAEGHIYSVRVTGETTTIEPHESVEEWLRARTGTDAPTRPPGL
jgi:hypothetical protein